MPPDSIKIPDISAEEDVMVIHRNIGLGKDLDWLKDLQAQKILLISKDAQQQRRLKLQLLQDSRFIVLTEEEAAAAQIRLLQEEVSRGQDLQTSLEEKLLVAEEMVRKLEGKAQEQESLLTELRSQLQQQEQEAKQQVERLQQENQTWAEKQQGQERENARLERQLELLRDLLRIRLQPTEANATAD